MIRERKAGTPMPARSYESEPCHALAGAVGAGYGAAVAALVPGQVLAVDGPGAADWDRVASGVCDALSARGVVVERVDMRAHFAAWADVLKSTASALLEDDPDFAPLAQVGLADLLVLPTGIESAADAVTVVFGPGAALVGHDVLWYADLPKRFAEAQITSGDGRNLGQPEGTGAGTTRRLFYIDWPVLDRHRDGIVADVDLWLDTQDADTPSWLAGPELRGALGRLVAQPFRTRPTFNTTSWGGHWAQKELGFNEDAPNTALGYELIAPESGILVVGGGGGGDAGGTGDGTADGTADGTGDAARVEVPLQVLVALHPREVLGHRVHETFGTSFPIRFDYLDTVGGGNLSVHCHPQSDYMRRVFGWPYTQHETYYMMVGGEGRRVFLGLHGDADLEGFRQAANRAVHEAVPFDIERYVQSFPADPHQLFLIPAGTPHGSGEGNVVLEISATPYLYSLRFYDWLRTDREGRQRPVHVGHAFENLDPARSGDAVARDLVQQPRTVRSGDGWREDVIGRLPEMFFEVHRIELAAGADVAQDTDDRFHILNVVEGEGLIVEADNGSGYTLAYAETLTIPAVVGAYRVRALGESPVRYVKAFVR